MSQAPNPAREIIARFGGLQATAEALKSAGAELAGRSTVQYWQRQGYIPPWWHEWLAKAARAQGVTIRPGELRDQRPAPRRKRKAA